MWLPCDIFVKDDNEVDLTQQILQLKVCIPTPNPEYFLSKEAALSFDRQYTRCNK